MSAETSEFEAIGPGDNQQTLVTATCTEMAREQMASRWGCDSSQIDVSEF